MKNLTILACSLLLAVLLVGCGGGGGGGGQPVSVISENQTPEQALQEYIASWKVGPSPLVNLKTKQVTQIASGTQPNLGVITLTDLSGEKWTLIIIDIHYPSPQFAHIKARYSYNKLDEGLIDIEFQMVKILGVWKLDDLAVEEVPWVVGTQSGIQGIITDGTTKLPISGALVTIAGTNYSTSTDQTGWYSFANIPPGTYTIVVARDGYVIKTIPGVIVT